MKAPKRATLPKENNGIHFYERDRIRPPGACLTFSLAVIAGSGHVSQSMVIE